MLWNRLTPVSERVTTGFQLRRQFNIPATWRLRILHSTVSDICYILKILLPQSVDGDAKDAKDGLGGSV